MFIRHFYSFTIILNLSANKKITFDYGWLDSEFSEKFSINLLNVQCNKPVFLVLKILVSYFNSLLCTKKRIKEIDEVGITSNKHLASTETVT